MEKQTPSQALSEQYNQLLELEPKFITNYVPANAVSEKKAFITGAVHNPNHVYDKLNAIDFHQRYAVLDLQGQEILGNPDLNPKFTTVYAEFITGYKDKTRLMELAALYKQTEDPESKARLKDEYMQLNIDLYGAPIESTYRSLLHEKLTVIDGKNLTGAAEQIRNELFEMVDFNKNAEVPERFKPSEKTVSWMHEVVESLYGDMLARVPDQESFDVNEVKAIFEDIIANEFGESADGWRVDVEPAKSINVKTTEKRIVIPEDREDIKREALNGLVVHELGVHMLRSITGGETNLDPLRNGLNEYYDSEEGLGVVMEQAFKGKFKESGIEHYITAGLAYFDNKDFRDAYEVKWRLSALSKVNDTGEIDEESLVSVKNTAYAGVMRSMRGTDELPWFKDLAYYNGAVGTWRHLEQIRGDDLKFMFILMGKANAANSNHERILLETADVA